MKKNKFKVGDVVICINARNTLHLKFNKEYTVLGIDSTDILIQSTFSDNYYYSHHLFKLKEESSQLIEESSQLIEIY